MEKEPVAGMGTEKCHYCNNELCDTSTDITTREFEYDAEKKLTFQYHKDIFPPCIVEKETRAVYRPHVPQYCRAHWNKIIKCYQLGDDVVIPYAGVYYVREDVIRKIEFALEAKKLVREYAPLLKKLADS